MIVYKQEPLEQIKCSVSRAVVIIPSRFTYFRWKSRLFICMAFVFCTRRENVSFDNLTNTHPYVQVIF